MGRDNDEDSYVAQRRGNAAPVKPDVSAQIPFVDSLDSLVRFIEALSDDAAVNADHWENITVAAYLEAMARWAEDLPQFYERSLTTLGAVNRWRMFAELLLAPRSYE